MANGNNEMMSENWRQRARAKVLFAAVAAMALGVLTALVWPTIQRALGSGAYTPSRIGAAAIVAATFFVIGLLVYFVAAKTLWELAELLIVPLVLVGIGLLFEMQQADRQQAMEEQQQALEERRAKAEQELAEQRAHDEALQAYLNQMSTLLLENDLRSSAEESEVRILARARTLTVLRRLDPSRRAAVLEFLAEAELIQGGDERTPIISLRDADLSGANLRFADLSDVDLSEADLSNANLTFADLSDADLSEADLRFADLFDADLSRADLSHADLLYAKRTTLKQLDEAKTLAWTRPRHKLCNTWVVFAWQINRATRSTSG